MSKHKWHIWTPQIPSIEIGIGILIGIVTIGIAFALTVLLLWVTGQEQYSIDDDESNRQPITYYPASKLKKITPRYRSTMRK